MEKQYGQEVQKEIEDLINVNSNDTYENAPEPHQNNKLPKPSDSPTRA